MLNCIDLGKFKTLDLPNYKQVSYHNSLNSNHKQEYKLSITTNSSEQIRKGKNDKVCDFGRKEIHGDRNSEGSGSKKG